MRPCAENLTSEAVYPLREIRILFSDLFVSISDWHHEIAELIFVKSSVTTVIYAFFHSRFRPQNRQFIKKRSLDGPFLVSVADTYYKY